MIMQVWLNREQCQIVKNTFGIIKLLYEETIGRSVWWHQVEAGVALLAKMFGLGAYNMAKFIAHTQSAGPTSLGSVDITHPRLLYPLNDLINKVIDLQIVAD